ncbi:MAG: murein hydrolase activator EnvC family protein [bacterium]
MFNPLFFFLCLSALSVEPMTLTARAQTPEAEQEQQRIKDIEQRLENNNRNAEQLKQTEQARQSELAGLRQRLIETADSLREAEMAVTNTEQRLEEYRFEEQRLSDKLAKQQRDISDTIAGLQAVEMAKPPALAVSPQDATKAARTAMILSATIDELQARIDQIKADISTITTLRTEMDADYQRLRQSEAELQSRRSVLEQLLADKESEFSSVSNRVASLEAENAQLAKEARNIRDVITRISDNKRAESLLPKVESEETKAARRAALTRRPALDVYYNLPKQFSKARGKIPYPVAGLLTGKFGTRDDDGTKRDGLSIQTRGGAVVTAPFSGEIVFARELPRTGNVLIIDVGEGYHIVMVGLASFEVREGTQVDAGQPLGYMPDTANRSDLFLQIRYMQRTLNPSPWLLAPDTG